MSEVMRYNCYYEHEYMDQDSEGEFVRYGDYLTLQRERDEWEKLLESVYHDISDLPELNMVNDDREQIELLNNGVCDIYNFLYEKLGKAAEAAKGDQQ